MNKGDNIKRLRYTKEDIQISKEGDLYYIDVPLNYSVGYHIINTLEIDLSARISSVEASEDGMRIILREV